MNKLKVLDLFCGGGGFSRGFYEAGFEIVAGVEIDKEAALTYSYNFPKTKLYNEDIRKLPSNTFDKYQVDIIIGGPPCEGYTPINPKREKEPILRLYKDERGRLTLEYIRFLAHIKPKYFVMENVLQITEGHLKQALINEFKWAGYENIYFNVIRCEKYGLPSRRTRMFISNFPIQEYFEKYERDKKTVWDAIKDLPIPYFPHEIENHFYVEVSKKLQKRIAKTPIGKSALGFKVGNKTYWTYERLDPYKISPTVRGTAKFIHPFENRILTVREHARLMSYPDYHVFLGGTNAQYNQVGESVPPLIAYKIARLLKKIINKEVKV